VLRLALLKPLHQSLLRLRARLRPRHTRLRTLRRNRESRGPKRGRAPPHLGLGRLQTGRRPRCGG
jgi:hypothetical protein